MNKFKYILKILTTNWIHLFGFYITTYLSLILFKLIGFEEILIQDWTQWSEILFISPFGILLLFFSYGLIFIIGFLLVISLIDMIILTKKKIKLILLIEWLIITFPFLIWGIIYDYPLFLILPISFFVTQLIREKKIKKIIEKTCHNNGYAPGGKSFSS